MKPGNASAVEGGNEPDRVAVEVHGKVVGAFVTVADLDRLEQLDASAGKWAWMDDMRPRFAGVSEEELMEAVKARAEIQARHFVTGDKELQAIGEFQGVKIRSPQAFLEEIGEMG